MFQPIRPSSGQQSLGMPRIQFCQNKQITLKIVWYVAICKMNCVYVILKVELLKSELLKGSPPAIQNINVCILFTFISMAPVDILYYVICYMIETCRPGLF